MQQPPPVPLPPPKDKHPIQQVVDDVYAQLDTVPAQVQPHLQKLLPEIEVTEQDIRAGMVVGICLVTVASVYLNYKLIRILWRR